MLIVPAIGQTRETLVNYFGEPSETFMASKWIAVTAHYSREKKVDKLTISLRYSSSIASPSEFDEAVKGLRTVLDQVVPASSRGKLLHSGFINVECMPELATSKLPANFRRSCVRSGSYEEYEKLWISSGALYSTADPKEMLRLGPPFIEVTWK